MNWKMKIMCAVARRHIKRGMTNNHIARLEDWPVMPVENIGFKLKPSGFFDRNPALDVPPSNGAHCH